MILYSLFNLKNQFNLLLYSIGSRLVNRTPKGLKDTYEFVRKNRNHYHFDRVGSAIVVGFKVNSCNYTIHMPEQSSDSRVFEQIFENNEYKFVVDIMLRLGTDKPIIIDAGANVGYTTLYLKSYFSNAKIIALEPIANTFRRLSKNIELNRLNGIEVIQKGLWGTETFLAEDHSFRDGQDWSFRLVEVQDKEQAIIETMSVHGIMLSYHINEIDLLKIDIEGGEKDVFNGDVSWLNSVKIIALEIHDEFNCRQDIERILNMYNFHLECSGELTVGINKSLCNV